MKNSPENHALLKWQALPRFAALVLLLSLLGKAHSSAAPAPAPLGSPQYAPSPDQPVGWRGDGTRRYPAATPVIAEGKLFVHMTPLYAFDPAIGKQLWINTNATSTYGTPAGISCGGIKTARRIVIVGGVFGQGHVRVRGREPILHW